MGAEIIVPLLMTAASAGMSAYNTNKTAKREDRALADSIRAQASKQKQADARTLKEVSSLEGSSSRDEEAKRMDQYASQLRRNRGNMQGSTLTSGVGGDAFTADAAQAMSSVDGYAGETADLMSRADAPGMQRQGEAFGFGKLATDIGLIQRESRGQAYIDELRRRSIRRNPWLDMASGLTGAAAGAFGGMGGGGTTGASFGPLAGGYALPFGGPGSVIPSTTTSYGLKLPNFGG